MKKNIYYIAVIFVLSFFSLSKVLANDLTAIEKLDSLADQTLQLTKVKRYAEAEQLLTLFEVDFQKAVAKSEINSKDQIAIITSTQKDAQLAITKENSIDSTISEKITSFRLAVDAIQMKNSPLWIKLKTPIMISLNEAEKAIKKRDQVAFNEHVDQVLSQYQILVPSVKINLGNSALDQLEKNVQHLDVFRNQIFLSKSSAQDIPELKKDFEKIFSQAEKEEVEPSIWWVIGSTGGIIISTLSYVGWRRYKAEKLALKKKE